MSTEPEKPTSSFFEQSSFTPVKPSSSGWRSKSRSGKPQMPWAFPLGMLIVCVLLAIVDLAFLNRVIGQVLDVGPMMSFFVSSGLGLVGLAFMMHLGYREAEPNTHHIGLANYVIHYSLWILLGLLISAARFFAGPIMGLTAEDGVAVWTVASFEVRQEDVIFAPIMFLLYLITGIGAKEAIHNLLLNADFHQSRTAAREKKEQKTKEKEEAKQEALAKIAQAQKEKEDAAKKVLAEREQSTQAKKEAEQTKKEAERKLLEAAQPLKEEAQQKAHRQKQLKAARGDYFDEVKRYKNLESKFHSKYQDVSSLIAKLEAIEGETQSLTLARDNILGAIEKSQLGVQQQVAFLIHGRTQESIAELKAVISSHNDQRS